MRQLGVLLASLNKDFKIVLRNWQTIVSIMILPFFMIAVIGFVFASGAETTINVGLENMELDFIEPIRTINLMQVDSCEEAILSRAVKACIRQTDQNAVTVLIDNTEVNLYPHIISLIQRGFERSNRNFAIQQIGALQGSLQNQLESLDDIVVQVQIVDVLFEEQKREFSRIQLSLNVTSAQVRQKLEEIRQFNEAVKSSKNQFDYDKALLESDIRQFRSDLLELQYSINRIDMNRLEEFDSSVAAEVRTIKSKLAQAIDALDIVEDNLERNQDMYMLIIQQGESMQNATEGLLHVFETQEKALIESAERLDIVQNTSHSMIIAIQGIKDSSSDVLNFSAEGIVNSMTSRFEPMFDLDIRLLLMPVVLMMVIVFLALIVSSLLGYEELNSKAMIRIELSETRRDIIDLSKLIIILAVVSFNVLLLLLFASASWNIEYGGNFMQIMGYSLMGTLTFACLGLSISYMVRKPFLLFISSTFVALIFIMSSGILRPKELLSASRAFFVNANPAAMILEGMRAFIFGTSSADIVLRMVGAMIFSIVILTIARIYWKKSIFRD
jgi:hypothetical protein